MEQLQAEEIARVCHEAGRAYSMVLGDHSVPTWDQAPAWMRESVIAGVVAAMLDPSTTPEQGHERWLAHRKADGWTYGPVKRPEAKEHPCFMPWSDLPPEQRAKDALFLGVVRALAPAPAEPAMIASSTSVVIPAEPTQKRRARG